MTKVVHKKGTKFYLFFNPKFHILSTYDTWVRRLLHLKPEVKSIFDFQYEDFTLEGYDPWPAIKAPVAV